MCRLTLFGNGSGEQSHRQSSDTGRHLAVAPSRVHVQYRPVFKADPQSPVGVGHKAPLAGYAGLLQDHLQGVGKGRARYAVQGWARQGIQFKATRSAKLCKARQGNGFFGREAEQAFCSNEERMHGSCSMSAERLVLTSDAAAKDSSAADDNSPSEGARAELVRGSLR